MAQAEEIDVSWRIGELAAATGVTVRALHHYDRLGLLAPRERSASGYRLYGRGELERLYVIVALRELGLSLAQISDYLGASGPAVERAKLGDVVERHLTAVERQLEAQQATARRLHGLLGALRSSADPSISEVQMILEAITMHNKYYTPEQLAELEERKNELGPEGMERAQRDWAELIAAVEAEKDAGTDPSDARMKPLVEKWQGLISAFTGGDPQMLASLKKMYESEGPEQASRGLVDPEVMGFMNAAIQAHS